MPTREYGFVYIASTSILRNMGIYKVGSSNNLARRMRELSAKSSSPEEFTPVFFVRCEDLNSAKALERAVHNSLDEEEFRYKDNKEFFKTGTPLPIVRCLFETAQLLEIPIIKKEHHDLGDLLDDRPSCPVPADRLLELDDVARKAYERAAYDLSAQLGAFFVGGFGIEDDCTEAEKERYNKLTTLILQLQERLEFSLETEEYMVPLNLIFIDAMRFVYAEEKIKGFRDKLEEYAASERESEPYYFESKGFSELKEEIRKHKSKIRSESHLN